MNSLQKELERKKKALQGAEPKDPSSSRRYVRAGDLRRRQWELEERTQQQLDTNTAKRSAEGGEEEDDGVTHKKPKTDDKTTTTEDAAVPPPHADDDDDDNDEVAQLTAHQVTEKLRLLGLPVRLFGEGTDGRRQRLRRALAQRTLTLKGLQEKEEFRLEKGHSIRNTFLEKEEYHANNNNNDNDESRTTTNASDEKDANTRMTTITAASLPTDPHKRVYKYFKDLLREWEDDLSRRPEQVKRSVAGKNETKTMQQCRDYIAPLFRQCKKRQVEEGQLRNICQIVDHCVAGEFVKAHDAYINVAIGRAAWPIGVTMVGIHARSGRAKIESSNVAHVMNSELQRKYLSE